VLGDLQATKSEWTAAMYSTQAGLWRALSMGFLDEPAFVLLRILGSPKGNIPMIFLSSPI
jgi:hypothetical protein